MNFLSKLPIFSISDNRIVSSKGEISYLYKVTAPDLNQNSYKDIDLFFNQLRVKLNKSSSDSFFRFYFLNINQKIGIFLNTNLSNVDLPEIFVSDIDMNFKELQKQINSDICIKDNYFLFGTKYYRLISLKEVPEVIDHLTYLGLCDYIISFKKDDKAQAVSNLKLRRKLHHSLTYDNIKNIESSNAYQESESLLEELTDGIDEMYKMEIFFIPCANSLEELNQKTKELLNELLEINAKGFIENGALSYLLTSLFPGVCPNFKRGYQVPGTYLVNNLNLTRDFVMEKGMVFQSVYQNECYFDLFSDHAHNYNVLITGSSGQGKSMLGNKIISECLDNGVSAVILDLGHSFDKTAKYFDGEIFSNNFNPLRFSCPYYLKEFIKSAISDPLSHKEEGKLFDLISKFNISSETCFLDLLNYLETDFGGIKYYFSEVLPFFENIKNDSGINNNLAINKLTYIDLTSYPEQIKSPLIIYLIEYFKNIKGQKVFLFDECWHLLGKHSNYLSECFRTFRKMDASAIAISQNIDDFVGSALGRVIIQNTYFKFFFKQHINDQHFLRRETKDTIELLYSHRDHYSEFLLEFEGVRKMLRYFPTNLEYELFLSSVKENNSFNRYQGDSDKYFSFKRIMDNFVSLKYANSINNSNSYIGEQNV